jgi:hypothetical protein
MADLALPQTLTLPEDFASALGEPVATLDEVVQQALNSAAHRALEIHQGGSVSCPDQCVCQTATN